MSSMPLVVGVDYATKKYGGMEYAMATDGNEVSGYYSGPASIVGQLVGVRHSHLDNGGYDLDHKAVKKPMNAR
jgi:aldehyde:ferredoxin oxidoreductase